MMVEQYHVDDLVGAYVLGAVTPEEAAEVEAHLPACALCRRLESELREVEMALPELAGEMDPPPGLKTRLMAAVAAEPRGVDNDAKVAATPTTLGPVAYEATPAPAEPTPLRRPVVERRGTGLRRLDPLLALAAAVLFVALGSGAWLLYGQSPARPAYQVTVMQAAGQPPLKGTLSYYKDGQRLVLDLHTVTDVPANRVYELWLVHANSKGITGVTGVGTFRPSTDGTAYYEFSGHNPSGYQLAALTVEKGFTTTPTFPIKALSKQFGAA